MHDKISDISAIVGISPQSVRLYETHGIVEMEKDPATGYRYFSRPALNNLLSARRLRAYEFDLPEIAHLLNDAGPEEIGPAFDARIDALAAELARRKAVLAHLKEERRRFRNAARRKGRCRVCTSPGFYFLPYMENDVLLKSQELRAALKEWSAATPFVGRLSLFTGEVLKGRAPNAQTGYYLHERYASCLCAERLAAARYIPPARSVYFSFFIERDSPTAPLVERFRPVAAYFAAHGLRLAGEIQFYPLVLLHRSTSQQLLGEACFPCIAQ